jgi:hypothetical protein
MPISVPILCITLRPFAEPWQLVRHAVRQLQRLQSDLATTLAFGASTQAKRAARILVASLFHVPFLSY